MVEIIDTKGTELTPVNNTDTALMQNIHEYKMQLRQQKEVQDLTSEISIENGNSILAFGQKPSQGISQTSDRLLSSMQAVKAEEASKMLVQLTKIMDKFDIEELKDVDARPSVFQRLFNKVKATVDDLFAKYDDMGKEVDKVYQILHQYETQIDMANADLDEMFKANMKFYQELEKYIVAGEIAQEEIEQQKKLVLSNNSISEQEQRMYIQKLDMAKDMLNQRVYDLQIAENIAIQSAPMIQTMQMSNFNLKRKINSSFIITLPIFKQCLVQAIQLKRQEIQAKSLEELDKKTNELLLRNAQNTADQSVRIAKMASGSSVQIETLQQTYQTIMKGIEETKAVNDKAGEERAKNSTDLEILKQKMKNNSAFSLDGTPTNLKLK